MIKLTFLIEKRPTTYYIMFDYKNQKQVQTTAVCPGAKKKKSKENK